MLTTKALAQMGRLAAREEPKGPEVTRPVSEQALGSEGAASRAAAAFALALALEVSGLGLDREAARPEWQLADQHGDRAAFSSFTFSPTSGLWELPGQLLDGRLPASQRPPSCLLGPQGPRGLLIDMGSSEDRDGELGLVKRPICHPPASPGPAGPSAALGASQPSAARAGGFILHLRNERQGPAVLGPSGCWGSAGNDARPTLMAPGVR